MTAVAKLRDEGLYTEASMARALATFTFKGQLCVVDNCYWTGHECDLLVVTKSLRVVDVEIKISRADLKADRRKDKWVTPGEWRGWGQPRLPAQPRDWPQKVWKHYYAVAEPVWRDDLLEHCGAVSGVLVVRLDADGNLQRIRVKRKAKPCLKAPVLTAADVFAIARLTSLRLWDARLANDLRG